MRIISLSLMTSILLAVSPLALAQTSTSSPNSSSTTHAVPNQSTASTQGSSADQGSNSAPAKVRQELRQSLEQSGFKDIHIAAESYAISATAPDGSHVVMTISPGSVEGIVESGSQSQGANSTSKQ